MLARWARPLAVWSALLLIVGVTLTGLNLLLVGWSVYAIGHVGAIAAFVAVCAAGRGRMEPWTWLGLGVLVVGLVLGLPQVASIWQEYAQEAACCRSPGARWTCPSGRRRSAWRRSRPPGLASRSLGSPRAAPTSCRQALAGCCWAPR